MELDSSGEGLIVTAVYRKDGLPDVLLGRHVEPGEGVTGRVLRTGQPMIIDSYARWHGRVTGTDEALMQTIAAVPLFGRQGVIGVLGVGSMLEGRTFTEDDVQILTLFAQQAAAVLEHVYGRRQAEALILSEERMRLARELHDGLAQDLASLLLRADLCQALADEENHPLRAHLEAIGTGLQRSIRDTRAMIYALRQSELDGRSLEEALRILAARCEAETHVRVHFRVGGGEVATSQAT